MDDHRPTRDDALAQARWHGWRDGARRMLRNPRYLFRPYDSHDIDWRLELGNWYMLGYHDGVRWNRCKRLVFDFEQQQGTEAVLSGLLRERYECAG